MDGAVELMVFRRVDLRPGIPALASLLIFQFGQGLLAGSQR